MSVFTGNIESVTIGGRTFEVFKEAIDRANYEISKAVAGQSITTAQAGSQAAARATIHELQASRAARFSVSCEVAPIGIRGWRMLTTGRPRNKRADTKAWNRARRDVRRQLVRAAGRAKPHTGAFQASVKTWAGYFDGWGRISVPRAFRCVIGPYIGGTSAR